MGEPDPELPELRRVSVHGSAGCMLHEVNRVFCTGLFSARMAAIAMKSAIIRNAHE